MDQITQIGFYNPEKPETPLETLTTELERKRACVNGSLLVLPEAFNIGTPYSQGETAMQKDPQILYQLQKICGDFDICIVAGLIISSPADHGRYPYNSVYLIDERGAGLLCHKMNSDSQGPYTNCLDGCDGHNAIGYRNVALFSLICMDAYTENAAERHQCLEKKMSDVPHPIRIMCVPAYLEQAPKEFFGIPSSYRIVANSASRTNFQASPGSFIERIHEDRNTEPLVGLENGDPPTCIKLYSLRA